MESEDELYDSDEEMYSESDDGMDVEVLYVYGNSTFGKMTVEEFINVPCWAFNRILDKKRVQELCKGILDSKCVHGVFTIACHESKNYLIDGQHRQQALIKAVEKDGTCLDFPIMVMIYNVENEAEIVDLFKKVNNTKPLTPKETPDSVVMTTVNRLGKDYPEAIYFDKNKTVYPYVLAKDLQERIRNICLDDITSDKLFTAVRKLNTQYAKKSVKSIPNVRNRLTKGAVDKAKKSGFYLGLDEKWSWIEKLEDNLQFNTQWMNSN